MAENAGGKGGTRTLDPGMMRPRDGHSPNAAPAIYVEYNSYKAPQ